MVNMEFCLMDGYIEPNLAGYNAVWLKESNHARTDK
jgi:hypothetical protein